MDEEKPGNPKELIDVLIRTGFSKRGIASLAGAFFGSYYLTKDQLLAIRSLLFGDDGDDGPGGGSVESFSKESGVSDSFFEGSGPLRVAIFLLVFAVLRLVPLPRAAAPRAA